MSEIYDKLLKVYEAHAGEIDPAAGFGVLPDGKLHRWVRNPTSRLDKMCILGAVLLDQPCKLEDYPYAPSAAAGRILGISRDQAREIVQGFDDHTSDLIQTSEFAAAGAKIAELARARRDAGQ